MSPYPGRVPESSPLPLPDPPLSDGTVALRPWSEEDIPALLAAGADPLIRRFQPSQPAAEAEIRTWLDGLEPARERGAWLELAVSPVDGAHVLGSMSLWDVRLRHHSAMLSYWLAADARGQGVATRAVGLLARWSFDALGLARIGLFIDPDNAASRRVAERCGAVHEGTLRSHFEHHGERRDTLLYGLLPEDLP